MSFQKEYIITVDIMKETAKISSAPVFIQNDTSVLKVIIQKNGNDYDYSTADKYIVHFKRADGVMVEAYGTYENGYVKYVLGATEMMKAGDVEVAISLYLGDTRITTRPFTIKILEDYENSIPSQGGYTVLQELFIEVEQVKIDTQQAAEYATQQGDYAKSKAENFTHKGDYSPTVAYKNGNVVTYGGINYICIQDSIAGIDPLNGAYWTVVSPQASINDQTWTATEGQTVFTITNGNYVPNQSNIQVLVGGVPQVSGQGFAETNSTTITLSEGVPVGTTVFAKWFEGTMTITKGHKTSHEVGGQDELDVSKLYNYKEMVSDKFDSVDAQLAEKAKEIVSVLSPPSNLQKAKVDGTDTSIEIQAIINYVSTTLGGGVIYFPKNVYVMKNVVQKPNTVLMFAPKTTLKFPDGSGGNDRMIIVGEITASNLPPSTSNDFYGIQGNGVTIEASHLPSSNTINGIFVSGAKNFEIDNVIGNGFTNGYIIFLIKSYGTPDVYCKDGVIKNIKCHNQRGWGGAVAAECGENIDIERIYSSKGVGVNLEADVDVMGSGNLVFKNINIKNVRTQEETTVSVNPKKCYGEDISISEIYSENGGSLFKLYYDITFPGYLKNITVDTGLGDGKNITDNGAESPNDVIVQNLIVRNVHLKNYKLNGFKMNGGTWDNCTAKNNGEFGWKSTAQNPLTVPIAKFYNCEATDNNVNDIVNGSGWSMSRHDKLEFYSCKGTDTNATKKQWYAVFSGNIFAFRCKFEGNKVNRFADVATKYEYFPADTTDLLPFTKLSSTITVTQKSVAHGLNRVPSLVLIKPKANGVVWESAVADATNVYLTASVSTLCDIYVG